ncbi:MAG: M48 family metallopeptidase [Candidatus Aminicenantes bacterium]|nr:MAG: M48 family metallopeptidase [Candidatus Aminicenantes bacterium]
MKDNTLQKRILGNRHACSEEPKPMEFEGIPFEVIRRRVKYSRVEFKTPGLRVIVPRGISPLKVLEDNKHSILKKYYKLIYQMETARKIPMTDWTEEEFNTIVSGYVARYCKQLKVKTPTIKFRKMKRRWGSCRSSGIITLNVFLQFVPEHLIAYIIYHELAHMIVRGHNRKFKAIIAKEFPNYRQLDKKLNLYGLKLLS